MTVKRGNTRERIIIMMAIEDDGYEPVLLADQLLKRLHSLRCYFNAEKNKVRASESYGFCAESLYKPRWQMYDKSTSKKHFLTTPKMMKMYKSSVASAADHTINPRSTF